MEISNVHGGKGFVKPKPEKPSQIFLANQSHGNVLFVPHPWYPCLGAKLIPILPYYIILYNSPKDQKNCMAKFQSTNRKNSSPRCSGTMENQCSIALPTRRYIEVVIKFVQVTGNMPLNDHVYKLNRRQGYFRHLISSASSIPNYKIF